jgi:hypothetical protein
MSAEVIIDNTNSTLRLTKLDIDGNLVDSYQLDTTLSGSTYIESSSFNASSNVVALFGRSADIPVIIRIQLNDYTPGNVIIDEFIVGDIEGLVTGNYAFGSGVVQDDNSIIVLGDGHLDETTYSPFLVKLKADASTSDENPFNTTFDDYSNDLSNDTILSIDDISVAEYLIAPKLIQLPDLALVLSISDDGDSYLVKLTDSDNSTPGTQEYSIDTNFSDNGVIRLDMSSLSSSGDNPLSAILDFTATENNELILVGTTQFHEGYAGFIAKFDSTTGLPNELLGNNSQPGYYVPNGVHECSYLQETVDDTNTQVESDLCNIIAYHTVSVDDDESIIIHAVIESTSTSTAINSAILKFKEQQDDNATPYTIYSGSAD